MSAPLRESQNVRVVEMLPSELWDAADKPTAKGASREDSTGTHASEDWDMGVGYKGAVRLAREGWPEGLELIAPVLARVDELVAHAMPEPQPVYDVVGDAPDVGAYLAGVPENMLTQEEAEGRHRLVRLLVNVSASWGVSSATIRARGTLACALADALERAGYRCEIFAVFSTDTRDGKHRSFTVRTLLKRAEEPLCMDRIVFALVHPAFMRRILFRIVEQIPDEDFRESFIGNGGYGRPASIVGDKGDVVISEMYGHDWTAERIAEEVARYLAEVGVHMEGAPR